MVSGLETLAVAAGLAGVFFTFGFDIMEDARPRPGEQNESATILRGGGEVKGRNGLAQQTAWVFDWTTDGDTTDVPDAPENSDNQLAGFRPTGPGSSVIGPGAGRIVAGRLPNGTRYDWTLDWEAG
jgi:hypothetical protein